MKILSEEELELKFQERIDKGEIIEPKDWMPERYRKQLIRMMSQHAHSEIVGMLQNIPASSTTLLLLGQILVRSDGWLMEQRS